MERDLVTTDELGQAFEREAVAIGVPPLNPRAFRDLREDGVTCPAEAIGRQRGQSPEWVVPVSELAKVPTIVRLYSTGTKRKSLLRVYLWAAGFEYPNDDVRRDLQHELSRVVRRLRRQLIPSFKTRNHTFDLHLAGADDTLRKARLVPDRKLFRELALTTYSVGTVPRFNWTGNLFAQLAIKEGVPEIVLSELFRQFFGDLLGMEETNRGAIEIIPKLTQVDLEFGCLARAAMIVSILILAFAFVGTDLIGIRMSEAFAKVSRTLLLSPEWTVISLVWMSMFAYRKRLSKTLTGSPSAPRVDFSIKAHRSALLSQTAQLLD